MHVINKLKIALSDLSLEKKLRIIIFACIALLVLVTYLALSMIIKSYDSLLYKTVSSSMSYTADNINSDITAVEGMAYSLAINENVQHSLSEIDNSDNGSALKQANNDLFNTLNSYIQQYNYTSISYIGIYTDKLFTKTYIPESTTFDSNFAEKLAEQGKGKQGQNIFISDYHKEKGIFIVKEIRRINRLDSLGFLIINIDPEKLIQNNAIPAFTDSNLEFILSSANELLYESGKLSFKQADDLSGPHSNNHLVTDANHKKYLATETPVGKFDLHLISAVPYDSVYRTISSTSNLYLLLLAVTIIIVLLISNRFISSFTFRMNHLLEKIQAFANSDGTVTSSDTDDSNRKDEIGIIHKNFDWMADKINYLINVNLKNDLLKKDAQLKALQMQINPHFLYNTLETINWRAKSLGDREISTMVESLGELMHITLNNESNETTVSEEIKFVENYMNIQKIRFEEQLIFEENFSERVAPEISDTCIPRLCIQPLIENAIHYGLEDNLAPCKIILSISRENDDMIIEVLNTGSQFENSISKNLQDRQHSSKRSGIGLFNVDTRLKTFFGDRYGLSCFNFQGFAVARITIPITKISEVNHAEISHSGR